MWCLWPGASLPSPPPLPLTLDGNDDDTRLINYPRRGFKWRPPPNGGRGGGRGGGRDDPFEREKTFFLPINPNYRLSRRSRRPREEVRELACHSGKNRIFHEWPNSRNNGSEIVKGFSFFFFFFCSKLFINRGTVDIITIYMYRLAGHCSSQRRIISNSDKQTVANLSVLLLSLYNSLLDRTDNLPIVPPRLKKSA